MDARWAFLQPWLEALQAVLVRAGETSPRQDEQRYVCATLSCWPAIWDVGGVIAECTLYVELPADQASRQDSVALQRIREAVTIFETLAIVDNTAFEACLSEYMRVHQTEDESPIAVWPEWRFFLGGFLSADDAVTKAPYVTWGELLFGRREDMWEHSPGFCDAMKRLKDVGAGLVNSHRNHNPSIKWEIQIEVMNITGKQHLKRTKRKFRPLSAELERLMMMEAPPIFVIESVSDSIALLKMWQAAPIARRVGIEAEVETTSTNLTKYEASGIGQVAAALAHAEMPTFKLRLQDFVENDKVGRAIANAGFFFSVLCSGRTVCHLNGFTDFPALERHKTIRCLDVSYSRASDVRFGAFFSAFAKGKMIRKLKVRTYNDAGIYRDPCHWKWLAYAFWSRASNACVRALNVGLINLTEEHLSAMEAVLKYSYPQPAEHPTSSNTSHSQYGFANIQAGTELQPVGLRAGDDTVLVLSRDLRCRAHYKSSTVGNQLDVVVPGYGICIMPNVEVFESDDVVGSPSGFLTAETPCGVRSLTISFADIENNDLLPRFLALIGVQLQTLTLRNCFAFRHSVALDLSSVAAACPELQTLRVLNFEVTISDDNDAVRSWNLKRLHISGSDVKGFTRLLDDPSYRTSRELVELRIGRVWHGPRDQFRLTLDALSALKGHDGELLEEKFSLRSKIAFLSVVSCRGRRFVDSSVLSIVFAFAATPKQRRVVIPRDQSLR